MGFNFQRYHDLKARTIDLHLCLWIMFSAVTAVVETKEAQDTNVINQYSISVKELAPLKVQFVACVNGSCEHDLQYSWDFGDGAVSDSAEPLHTYRDSGTYIASFTISDGSYAASGRVVVVMASPAMAKSHAA